MNEEQEILKIQSKTAAEFNNQKELEDIKVNFNTRQFSDIIKNPDCTFVQEDKEKQFYYFCLCSEKAYFPICEVCASTCHKSHNPQIKIEGYFTCNCGLKNHTISERSQKRFEEKSAVINNCFYQEFYSKSYNKGFYKIPSGKNICSICFFSDECNSEVEKGKSEELLITNFNGTCECDKHHTINVVTLSNELNRKILLNNFMLNFNFNILAICPTLKFIFIDFLNEKIKELLYFEEKKKQMESFRRMNSNSFSIRNSYSEPINSYIFNIDEKKDPYIEFNTDFVIFSLFSIFKLFKKDYSSQFLHVKNIFGEIKPFQLIEILKKTVNFQRLLDYNENIELYFKTKANFAFMIYHVYIKSHFLNFNNLLNLKSLLNLNIVQRILYIHQSKKFYRFGLYSQNLTKNSKNNKEGIEESDIPLFDFDEKFENWENFIFEFSSEIVNIIDTMLQVHDNSPIIKNVMSDVMVTKAKIMKFLIKYNLIDEDVKGKYFEMILDTLVAFVNELDDSEQEYWDYVYELSEEIENKHFSELPHNEKIEILNKSGKEDESEELNEIYLENEKLKNNIWFVLPTIKSIFYHMLKKNDDLVIKKLKGEFSKIESHEKYCFISSSESDMISKIFLLCLKIFNENSYRNKNEESVYKKKILKFDLYVKKILEILNGNNEFYLKSLESITHQFKRKIDSIFIQDLGEEKNSPNAYIDYMKSSVFSENNIKNKLYNKLNMKTLTSENDFHMEILKNLNLKLFVEFNQINIDFGNLNKKFYEYDIDFKQFTNEANEILVRFQNFFRNLNFKPEKIKKKEVFNLDSIFVDNSNQRSNFYNLIENDGSSNNINLENYNNYGSNNLESQSFLKSERANNFNNEVLDNSFISRNNLNKLNDLNNKEEDNSINAVSNYIRQGKLNINKNPDFQKLIDFKQFIGYTDFLENFNEFLDIYSRAKTFDSKLNAINIRYDLLKFVLNMLYIISDDNNENIILIMTINPFKLVDAFYDYKEELCLLLVRLVNIVAKFDYNDNYFFLTDFINALIEKIEINPEKGMSQENFAVFTTILKSFKNLLPKYNIYNNELINTYELINNKIIELKNNEKMMKEITEFVNNLFPQTGNERYKRFESNNISINENNNNNSFINPSVDNSISPNNNLNEQNEQKLILNENKKHSQDVSIETINGTLQVNGQGRQNNNSQNMSGSKRGSNSKYHGSSGKEKFFRTDVYIFDTFFKNYFALLNIAFEKDLYYYELFYNKEILILNRFQLKEIISNSITLNISFREEIEKFLHNYNLKSKIKFTTVEREFSKFQRQTNSEKANLKHIFSGKFKEALNFSCELMEVQMKNFINNCGLESFNGMNNNNQLEFLNKISNNKLLNANENNNNKNILKNNVFLLGTMKNIYNIISKNNNFLNNSNNESEFIKINSVFSYLENAIISPLYKIINLYMIDKEKLIGDDYFTVYKLVFDFHQVLYMLYSILDIYHKDEKQQKKRPEYIHLSIYFYGDIKQHLNETQMDYLLQNFNKLKELKYFQFEETVNIFRVTLAMIKKNNTFNFIHLRKKFYRFNIIENSYLGCYDENSKDSIFVDAYDEIINEASDYFLDSYEKNLYEIIEEYKKILGETFGNQFSLIKSLESTDLDCEVDLTGILFNYLINKFADKLTRANQDYFIPQNVFTFDEAYRNSNNTVNNIENNLKSIEKNNNIKTPNDFKNFVEGKKLKMQNFYALFFLRNLFFFDPEKFQESLTNLFTITIYPEEEQIAEGSKKDKKEDTTSNKISLQKKKSFKSEKNLSTGNPVEEVIEEEIYEIDKEKFHYFLSIINKYFIFGNLLCEAGKLFELYNERTLIRSNFIYDLLITNIFLMQNICEGHNQNLQELMFDLRLKPLIELNNVSLDLQIQNENNANSLSIKENLAQKDKKDVFDKERIKFENFLKERKDFEFSYINFLSNLMRNIVSSLYFDYDNRYVFINKTFSLNSNFVCVYNKLTDLFIEMIQGTQEYNLYNFYMPEQENEIIPDSENINQIKNFQFLVFLYDIKEMFIKDGNDPEKEFSIIKTLTFSIINNILNQEIVDQDFIRILMKIFEIDFLIGKMSKYMKKLLVRFQKGILYEHPQFPQLVRKTNLKDFVFEDFYKIFLKNDELQKDDYFLLCVQIYYFINITGDKFYMQESMDLLELENDEAKNLNKDNKNKNQDIILSSTVGTNDLEIENSLFLKSNKLENKIKIFFEKTLKKKKNLFERKNSKLNTLGKFKQSNLNKENNSYNNLQNSINASVISDRNLIENNPKELVNDNGNNNNENQEIKPQSEFQEKKEIQIKTTPIPDILYTKMFYSQIIKSVEFVIEDESGSKVKEIYFIKNPIGYLINQTNIRNFFKNANRIDATTKITSLLDSLENFQIEIDYKLNIKNNFKQYLLRYDYKITDFISFILSLIINFILLFTLSSDNIDDITIRQPIFDSIIIIGLVQIAINFISLIIFLLIKQKLWITYELNNIRKTEFSFMGNSIVENDLILSKISFFHKLKVYLLDCLLFNEEIILINFNIVLGAIGVSQFSATMIFTVQLLTVIRFVETIRDIVQAFRNRFTQLTATVFFLLFMTYFYTNIGFYFLNTEYSSRGIGHVS